MSAVANIRVRKETGKLLFDFSFRGVRCREQTPLPDTAANRKRMKVILKRIEAEISLGTFDYARSFPNSPNARRFAQNLPSGDSGLPTIETFGRLWLDERKVEWRDSYITTIEGAFRNYVFPEFGAKRVDELTKPMVLAWRGKLATEPGAKGGQLSRTRINKIMNPLRMMMEEAADRFDIHNPCRGVKSLPVAKSEVEPFTLDEVRLILDKVRPDFRNYFTVRFFTGLRTGEIDGLMWNYVDFSRRLILVRETVVKGKPGKPKTDGSHREVQMSEPVYQALLDQHKATGQFKYVFCTSAGTPLEHNNVTKRVWYPLLRFLGLKPRRPYQTRHTAATLWLAAGEAPEWIARQMGHTNTEMLFRVYSRFVPNLTRQDGSAMTRLLRQEGFIDPATAVEPVVAPDVLAANDPSAVGFADGEVPELKVPNLWF